jgi:hypothetical protein
MKPEQGNIEGHGGIEVDYGFMLPVNREGWGGLGIIFPENGEGA